jgi:creatinine amidohydrolase
MRITDMTWMQVEEYLKKDDRAVLPIGSTEQHCYLSLSVDSILAAKMAEDAAAPLGIPVYPVLHYGLAHHWTAYPGTVTLRVETYMAVIRDILDSIRRAGFRRVLIVNGHGGNSVAGGIVNEWMMDHPDSRVKWHDWWNAPKTWEQVLATDPNGSHASWMENFPWTRLANVPAPDGAKPMIDMAKLRVLTPEGKREYVGDGNMGGVYQHSDEEMLAIWEAGVKETRALLEGGWE